MIFSNLESIYKRNIQVKINFKIDIDNLFFQLKFLQLGQTKMIRVNDEFEDQKRQRTILVVKVVSFLFGDF